MKTIITIIMAVMLSGCSVKYVSVEVSPDVDEQSQCEIIIDTTGSTVTTDTDQKADPNFDLDLPLGGVM